MSSIPKIGATVQFESKTAGGIVRGECLRADADKTVVRVTHPPDGSSYTVGKSFAVPTSRLSIIAKLIDEDEPYMTFLPKRKLSGPLVDIFRPKTLSDVCGQSDAVDVLTAYAANPYPCAFLLSGPTGTGKTSAAKALAADIGVSVDDEDFGGMVEIASGEQNGDAVRESIRRCHTIPMKGSGWRMILVNEADYMTSSAGAIWLDALERIPDRTVIVFTTNDPHKIPDRLKDRCIHLVFNGHADAIRPAMQNLADSIWHEATGRTNCPPIDAFGQIEDLDGFASFRRLLQRMDPYVRTGKIPQGKA